MVRTVREAGGLVLSSRTPISPAKSAGALATSRSLFVAEAEVHAELLATAPLMKMHSLIARVGSPDRTEPEVKEHLISPMSERLAFAGKVPI